MKKLRQSSNKQLRKHEVKVMNQWGTVIFSEALAAARWWVPVWNVSALLVRALAEWKQPKSCRKKNCKSKATCELWRLAPCWLTDEKQKEKTRASGVEYLRDDLRANLGMSVKLSSPALHCVTPLISSHFLSCTICRSGLLMWSPKLPLLSNRKTKK